MSELLNQTTFENIAIIVGGAILYVQNRRQGEKVKHVQETLTTNNGGSHIKDQLDRVEAKQDKLDQKIDTVQQGLAEHIEDSKSQMVRILQSNRNRGPYRG